MGIEPDIPLILDSLLQDFSSAAVWGCVVSLDPLTHAFAFQLRRHVLVSLLCCSDTPPFTSAYSLFLSSHMLFPFDDFRRWLVCLMHMWSSMANLNSFKCVSVIALTAQTDLRVIRVHFAITFLPVKLKKCQHLGVAAVNIVHICLYSLVRPNRKQISSALTSPFMTILYIFCQTFTANSLLTYFFFCCCWMWTRNTFAVSMHPRLHVVWLRSDHYPSSVRFKCIYTCTFMWSSTVWSQKSQWCRLENFSTSTRLQFSLFLF